MSSYLTIQGSGTFRFSDHSHKDSNLKWKGRLLNAPIIEDLFRDAGQSGQKLREISFLLDNTLGEIDLASEDLSELPVTFQIDGYSETWSGLVDAVDFDIKQGVLSLVCVEDTSAILQSPWPRFFLMTSSSPDMDASASNQLIPLPFGGTEAAPIRIPGLWADVVNRICVFCVGPIHACYKVEKAGTVITDGFTMYLGALDQAILPGFVCAQFDADQADDAGSLPEIVIEIAGLKLGAATIEECRNPARIFQYILTTASGGPGGWGFGVSSADLVAASFSQAITDCDTFGFRMDGIINEQKAAEVWFDMILDGCRGSRPFKTGKWNVAIDKAGTSVKTFHGDNSYPLQFISSPAKDRKNLVVCRYRYRYNQLGGRFTQTLQRPLVTPDRPKERTIELPLVADHATAGAIADYVLQKGLAEQRGYVIEALGSPGGGEIPGAVVTLNYPELGLSSQKFRVIRPQISDDQTLLEVRGYSDDIFAVTDPGAAPVNPTISQVRPGTGHILAPDAITALALTTGKEVRADGTLHVFLGGTFVPGRNMVSAQVELSQRDGETWPDPEEMEWFFSTVTKAGSFRIQPVNPGKVYKVRVTAFGLNGQALPVVSSEITAAGSTGPADPTGFAVVQDALDLKKVRFSWNAVNDPALAFYQIRKGEDWNTASVILDRVTGTSIEHWEQANGTFHYLIKPFDRTLTPSANAGSAEIVLKIYPSNVPNLTVSQSGTSLLLSWPKVPDLDLKGYEIREGPTWDYAEVIADCWTDISKEIQNISQRSYQFWVAAKSTRLYTSETPINGSITVTNLPPKNYVVTSNQIANPTGTHFQTEIGSTRWKWKDIPGTWRDYRGIRWNQFPGGAVLKLAKNGDNYFASGQYTFKIGLGKVLTCGLDIDKFLFVLPPGVSASVEYRYSVDDEEYSAWAPFTATIKTLAWIEGRVNLATTDVTKTPEVTRLTIIIDVPDVFRKNRVLVTDATDGTYVEFGYSYKLQPYVWTGIVGVGLQGEIKNLVKNADDEYIGAMVRIKEGESTYVTNKETDVFSNGY